MEGRRTDADVVMAVIGYEKDHGRAPSVWDVGVRLGYGNPNSVRSRLTRLRDAGAVEFEGRWPMTVRAVAR